MWATTALLAGLAILGAHAREPSKLQRALHAGQLSARADAHSLNVSSCPGTLSRMLCAYQL